MPAACSHDLRERVVAAVAGGVSRRHAAHQFKLRISTVIRWVARLAATGSCAAAPSGGDHKSKAVEMHKDWLLDLVKAEPDLTLTEIHIRLHATHGLKQSFSCLWRFFARHDISSKENSSRG
jgi:transposase